MQPSLDSLLKGTSRAFYLSLAVLPPGARAPLSLAYLLARAADTIADAPARGPMDRPRILAELQKAVRAEAEAPALPPELVPEFRKEAELLASIPRLLELLRQRPEGEAAAIRQVVHTLIDGMIWDQTLFLAGNPREASGLNDDEFERYTYLVAGCVGPFWSTVCALSDPRLRHLAGEHDAMATEFGKALQWVNILRDVPKDQRAGRYYLPNLASTDFPARFRGRARRALAAMRVACAYPLLFPNGYLRHRMAVFWPLVLGLRTLERLLRDGGPRPERRVKVPRWEVLGWIALSPLLVSSGDLLSLTLRMLWGRAERALTTMEETHATIP